MMPSSKKNNSSVWDRRPAREETTPPDEDNIKSPTLEQRGVVLAGTIIAHLAKDIIVPVRPAVFR